MLITYIFVVFKVILVLVPARVRGHESYQIFKLFGFYINNLKIYTFSLNIDNHWILTT